MEKSMRYITIEERELYEKLEVQYNIKDYSPPMSLMCHRPSSYKEKAHKEKVIIKKK
jgi:hypothetical protein